MLMRSSFFCFIVFMLFGIQSCGLNSCKQISLTADELEWFNEYHTGQIILFKNKNDESDIDSFKVSGIGTLYSQCNRLELGEFQYQSSAMRMNSINNCHNTHMCNVSFDFTKTDPNVDCEKVFYVFDLVGVIDSINYVKKDNDIYYFRNENESGIMIKSFDWSKKRGLVRYETYSGKIYELWEKGRVSD